MNTTLTLTQAEQGVQAFFGRTPQQVIRPLHQAVEAMNWMNALFLCIEEASADVDGSRSAGVIAALSSLGAHVAAEYQAEILGGAANDMQTCIEAAKG